MLEERSNVGQMVVDEASSRLVHYAEKPETFVRALLNSSLSVFLSPFLYSLFASFRCELSLHSC